MKDNLQPRHTSSENEFMDALEKLEQTLETREIQTATKSPPKSQPKPSKHPRKPQEELLLRALEEAAADIDRFIASKVNQSPSKPDDED